MSSSISSSSPRSCAVFAGEAAAAPSRTRRVLVVLALALAALEVVTRVQLLHMSKDFVQFWTYPGKAAALAGFDGTRIAIVGNSITHEDIDAPALSARIAALTGTRTRAEIFSVDHSYVETWRYVLERYFWKPGNRVDLIVVPFWGSNLYDGNELEIGRLAQFFTTVDDWPSILAHDLDTNAERADFLASSVWATFAARDRMRELVFTRSLPDFKGYMTREQNVRNDHLAAAAANRPKPRRAARALRRFLRVARAHGTRIAFIAFPTLHVEWSDTYADVARLVDDAGMRYVDLRAVSVVDQSSYVDLVHMNETGRNAFEEPLARTVAGLVGCDGPGCRLQSAAR